MQYFCYLFSDICDFWVQESEKLGFKWKVLNILSIVLAQVDSDTARITAARSIIYRCGQMLSQDQRLEDLRSFLQEAENHCTISYGDNNSKLSDFLQSVSIDEESALSIDAEKLQTGDYYNYHFLSVAVEITLLEEEARGNVRIREYASTMLTRLDYFLNNQECGFMRSDNNDYQTTEDYLRKVLGIGISSGARDKQLVVIDCSEINADTLELLTSVVSRLIFDYRKKLYGAQRRKDPVHLIMDEAHRYIKKDAQYILRENIFEKIAREGRKYSLYLILSSQRPSELSGTVLSQCGNYIVHRIQNEFDLKYVYSVLPYFSVDFENKIKQSVPGEALIFGNCVPMPLQVKIPRAVPDPDSDNCIISKEWFEERINESCQGEA